MAAGREAEWEGSRDTVEGAKTRSVTNHKVGWESAELLARKASKPATARHRTNGGNRGATTNSG